ncbi:MAG: acyclic terpene utilization AtuA family protein [bacterium]
MPRHKTIRIGCGAGFQGDRIDPAVILAAQGRLDWLVLECLAERTVAAAQLRRLADPEQGYDPLLRARMTALLPLLKRGRCRLISNLGAANPVSAGRQVVAIAQELGLSLKVAVVTGDDVLDRLDPDAPTLETGQPVREYGPPISANAYLGAEVILPAIATGADVIITGRVADPSLFLAPMIREFGWPLDDPTLLARGTVIGHLLECAGQLTGGYFADPGLKDVRDLAHLGFPFCDVDADGNGTLCKVAGTGGMITLRTVKEQLLYEVTDPTAYVTPDAVVDFGTVDLVDLGEDRVRIENANGTSRTGTLKVSVGYRAGFIGEGEISYAGPNARARAELAGAVLYERLHHDLPDLRIDMVGIDSTHGTNFGHGVDPYEVRLRAAASGGTRELAERVGLEVEALYTNGPAGGGGARKSTTERIGIVSTLMPRDAVHSSVVRLSTDRVPAPAASGRQP